MFSKSLAARFAQSKLDYGQHKIKLRDVNLNNQQIILRRRTDEESFITAS